MKKIILIILSFVFLLFSCGKEEIKNVIPIYPVNFKLDLNNLDNILKTPVRFKTFETPRVGYDELGFSGLLVVSSPLGEMNNPILFAYDLCCPNESVKHIKVKPSGDYATAGCDKCGSVFDLYLGDGTVRSGPSGNSLQVYRVVSTSERGVFYVRRKN